MNVPQGWDAEACRRWAEGSRAEAINTLVARLDGGCPQPTPLAMQLSYYLFLCDDYRAGAAVLENILETEPEYLEARMNLAACYSRGGQLERAVREANRVLAAEPGNALALDILTSAYWHLGNTEQARKTGSEALALKDRNAGPAPAGWRLPDSLPGTRAMGKRHVVSFSLWGTDQRYLRGAIRNALLAADIYPGWVCRFHLDETVPTDLADALRSLGAEVVPEAPGQSMRQKLGWRFRCANEAGVGFFLIRDVDSVINVRERDAVAAWLSSGRWFHVMRDWWTHTDLIMAGMWGGVGGVLPDLAGLLDRYDSGKAETPNIDQWFLRDRVWPLIRGSVLVHDRCFTPPGALPFPSPVPVGTYHVGQDEFAVRADRQEQLLAAWLDRLPCLRRS